MITRMTNLSTGTLIRLARRITGVSCDCDRTTLLGTRMSTDSMSSLDPFKSHLVALLSIYEVELGPKKHG